MMCPMLEGRRVSGAALLLLPAALLVYFAFNSGGFYPGPPAYVAVVLGVLLVLRMTIAENPFEGFSRPLVVAAGALSLYAILTLLSASWSHAPGRALVEFDLPLVYLLAMVLFGSIARTRERLEWMLRAIAVGIVAVCTCALITRVLPHTWPTSSDIANNRLGYPVSYWNVLGMLATMGIVLCMHISSETREARGARVAAAAAIPVLATTLYFTFSRGAIAAGVIALITYVLLGRPRLLVSAVVAVVPATAIALKVAYDANLLATPTPTTAPAVAQGRHVAIAVIGCAAVAGVVRALLLWLDERLVRVKLPDEARRRVVRYGWIGLAAVALVTTVALSGTITHQYDRFVHSSSLGKTSDLRARLTDPGNNGRIDMWKVAWRQFKSTPVVGQGAGTFQNTWAQHRPTGDIVRDAHSLYMETLDELGIVGLLLLLVVILTVLGGTATRARGPSRSLYAAVFAVLLAWAVQAGFDWDWEMPVVTLIFFVLGGFVLAAPQERSAPVAGVGPRLRTLAGLGCVLLAVAPAYVWLSQRRLNDAVHAFALGNCQSATQSAVSSISILGARAEPYEILSYCDIRRGMPRLAIDAIDQAISLDPKNWNYRYGLAVIRAAAGLDPRRAALQALQLNPRDPFAQDAWLTFRSGSRQAWETQGKAIASQFTSL
jgi:O-antigen ligase